MKAVYACLIGKWVKLQDDPDCRMGENRASPSVWYEESALIHAPINRKEPDTYYQLDYVHICYKGNDYRINPIFIQIVEE